MTFMTAASVRNLPGYIEQDRRRSELSDKRKKEQQTKQEERDTVDFIIGFEDIVDSSNNEQELTSNIQNFMQGWKDKGLPPKALELKMQMARQFKQDQIAKKGREQTDLVFEQGQAKHFSDLDTERTKKSDINTLTDLQNLQTLGGPGGEKVSVQGDESIFAVPESEESTLGRLSYGGRKQYEKDIMDTEQATANLAYKKAQTKSLGVPKSQKRTLYKPAGESIEVYSDKDHIEALQKGFGPVKPVGGTGQFSPSNLKKLISERQQLIEDGATLEDTLVKAYDNKISGEIDVDLDVNALTEPEINMLGAAYTLTGKMPALGRGKNSTKTRLKIIKSAARQSLGSDAPEGGKDKSPMDAALAMVGSQADTKAIQGSLNFLDKQLSSMGSFVTNLNSQIDRVGELSKDLQTFDTRLFNIPLRAVRGRIQGSPLQAKYDLFLTEIESEIGKLASGSTGSVAELSQGARETWAKIHDKNLGISDMLDLLEETKTAANFRVQSVQDQLNKTRRRMVTQGRNFEEADQEKTDKTKITDPLGIR